MCGHPGLRRGVRRQQSGQSIGGAGGQGGASGGAGGTGAVGGGGAGGEGGSIPDTGGNGTIEPPELCDGTELGGKTCQDFGLGSGTLVCNNFCGMVVSGCVPLELCGDHQDNDGDFLTDCQDDECAQAPVCTGAVPVAFGRLGPGVFVQATR